MAAPDISLPAALLQQSAYQRKRRQRRIPEIIDITYGEAGRGPERRDIALDD